jgi:hypothetical protein
MASSRLYCPTRARHRLAERRVTPDGIVLDVRLATHDARRGYVVRWRTLDAAAFTDTEADVLASQVHSVGCQCGRWSADLAALWRGQEVALEPSPLSPQEEREFGLNPHRSRHTRDEG